VEAHSTRFDGETSSAKILLKKKIDIQNRKRTYPFLWKYHVFRKPMII